MADSQFSPSEDLEEVPIRDVSIDQANDAEEYAHLDNAQLEQLVQTVIASDKQEKLKPGGGARRQLEDLKEAKALRQILSDYAWDEDED